MNEDKDKIMIWVLPFKSKEFEETWKDFVEHRKRKNSPLVDLSGKYILKKLFRYSESQAIKMMEKSIISGWLDVFPITADEDKITEAEDEEKEKRYKAKRILDERIYQRSKDDGISLEQFLKQNNLKQLF